ncbi:hypothetical protein Rs2_45044 [Raphanus sativus]|nr:hypothetical protein Rs2_45044 [Raphanus sativus]
MDMIDQRVQVAKGRKFQTVPLDAGSVRSYESVYNMSKSRHSHGLSNQSMSRKVGRLLTHPDWAWALLGCMDPGSWPDQVSKSVGPSSQTYIEPVVPRPCPHRRTGLRRSGYVCVFSDTLNCLSILSHVGWLVD